ncbi:hypothetical protein MKK55_00715 [Methylobacterium sp. J-059]|uniref:hypothetical protein n=1 Tax=Methylobacterium sp. J-059 TaxID=2836643 RepID=UPI001FB9E8D9|nr:hypothetical protein [Methylobacterium sp. J-059]MCJ2037490.1 hypothetical protein [Methylobacterium sp. J-059]
MIEEAAQTALDTADNLLAILDRMDGDAEAEDGGGAEPALAAPENHHGSQVVGLRNNDSGCEAASDAVPPVASAECAVIAFAPLSSNGRGNIIAAAAVAFLDMVAGGER